jgi:hypothetical protein
MRPPFTYLVCLIKRFKVSSISSLPPWKFFCHCFKALRVTKELLETEVRSVLRVHACLNFSASSYALETLTICLRTLTLE